MNYHRDRVLINQDGVDEFMVEYGQIITTQTAYASAWRRIRGGLLSNHGCGTITFAEDGTGKSVLWGKIGTDPDHNLFFDLPSYSKERAEACLRAYNERYEFAYKLIFQAFPWMRGIPHKESSGEIRFDVSDIPTGE